MRLLLDTHLLLWAAGPSPRLSLEARELIDDPDNELTFSVASIWEVAIKKSLGREDFDVDPHLLRDRLVGYGYIELPVTSDHAVGVALLPRLHKDPFDRILLAQAVREGMTLVTADARVAGYPASVHKV